MTSGKIDETGVAAAAGGAERRAPPSWGEARLMKGRNLVDYAVNWMNQHP